MKLRLHIVRESKKEVCMGDRQVAISDQVKGLG